MQPLAGNRRQAAGRPMGEFHLQPLELATGQLLNRYPFEFGNFTRASCALGIVDRPQPGLSLATTDIRYARARHPDLTREVIDNCFRIRHRQQHATTASDALFGPPILQEALQVMPIRPLQMNEFRGASSHAWDSN